MKLWVEVWLWTGALVFLPALWFGVSDYTSDPVRIALCLLAVVSVAAGLLLPRTWVRVWNGLNLLVGAFVAWGVVDMHLVNHGRYSGYGVLILAPMALGVALSQLGLCVVVRLHRRSFG